MTTDSPAGNGPVDRNVGRREHDPNHPYVRKLVGCGHGRLFSEPCTDCEIVGLHEQYRNAILTVQIVRDRLRVLGAPLPGRLAPAGRSRRSRTGHTSTAA